MVKVKDNLSFFEAWAELTSGLLISRDDAASFFYGRKYGYVKFMGGIMRGDLVGGEFKNMQQISPEADTFRLNDILSAKWVSYTLGDTSRDAAGTSDEVFQEKDTIATIIDAPREKELEHMLVNIFKTMEFPPFFRGIFLKAIIRGNEKEFD